MASQPVTVNLPEPLYERLQQRAAEAQRTVEEELLDALAAAPLQSYQEAIRDFDAALALTPDLMQSLNDMRSVLASLGNLQAMLVRKPATSQSYKEAVAAFDAAVAITVDLMQSLNDMRSVLASLDNLQAVLAMQPTAPAEDELPAHLNTALFPLALLDDEALWRAAQSHLPAEAAAEMERLHLKRQREGLTESEDESLSHLVEQYERYMLVRAQAAALLQERGHDPSMLRVGA